MFEEYTTHQHTTAVKNQPVGVVGEKVAVVLDGVGKKVSLVDQEEADVDDPEESVEESHVHVVVVTIIHQAAVNVLYQDKPEYHYNN